MNERGCVSRKLYLLTPDLEERGSDTKPLCTVCRGMDDALSLLLTCLGSELGLVSTVLLQPSCAPATPHIRHVWQPVSPPTHARMGCWARWTRSSAKCWERAVSALRAPSCTGATRHSASLRRSAVGSSKTGLSLGPSSPSSCPAAEA